MNMIGFAIYSYEGIGIVLPVWQITKDKKNYFKILVLVFFTVVIFYILFGEISYLAYGD